MVKVPSWQQPLPSMAGAASSGRPRLQSARSCQPHRRWRGALGVGAAVLTAPAAAVVVALGTTATLPALSSCRTARPHDDAWSRRSWIAAFSAAAAMEAALRSPAPALSATPSMPGLQPKGARGLKYADVREGRGQLAEEGTVVRVQWSGRLFSKLGWGYGRCGDPECELRFKVGDGTVIQGLDEGIRGMREGGIRRLLIPPPLAYQEGRELQPLPDSEAGKARLYRTVFNPTRIANGEGETLGTIVLDVSLTRIASQ